MGLWGQSIDQPLTNSQIETMVVNHVPDSTILLKIQIAAQRGLVGLDDSSTALAVLKAKGASEQVLNAVVWAAPFSAVWLERHAEAVVQQAEEKAAPGLPRAAGVYLRTSSGWDRLPSYVFWTPYFSGWAWMRGSREYSIPLSGNGGALQVSSGTPTFYVRQSRAGQEWGIAQVTLRNNQREIRMKEVAASQMQPVKLTPIVGDIFTLRPSRALTPGEYALCTGVPGGPGLDVCYSFAVQ